MEAEQKEKLAFLIANQENMNPNIITKKQIKKNNKNLSKCEHCSEFKNNNQVNLEKDIKDLLDLLKLEQNINLGLEKKVKILEEKCFEFQKKFEEIKGIPKEEEKLFKIDEDKNKNIEENIKNKNKKYSVFEENENLRKKIDEMEKKCFEFAKFKEFTFEQMEKLQKEYNKNLKIEIEKKTNEMINKGKK